MVDLADFRLTVEVKGYIYGEINRQKHEFPVFTGKITHAHSVYQAPLKGPGNEARQQKREV